MKHRTLLIAVALLISPFVAAEGRSAPPGPAWVQQAVFYEIYPQTFRDSNGDGVGDLPGIIEKLGYVRDLGANAIWLNPFYESPFRDAGYDVSDYYRVAPRYGTNEDAKRLFARAHALGLKVIIDFVPGHTSIDHPWFKDSARATPNVHSNWYIWTNSTWTSGIDRQAYSFIQGYSERDGCYMTNFFWHQPALNYGFAHPDPKQPWQLPVDHPDVLALKREMERIMRFWLAMGCDGFRVDMAGSLVKGEGGGEECARYWRGVSQRLRRDYPDLFLVSEWSDPIDAINGGFDADFLHWIPEYPDLFAGSDAGPAFFSEKEGGNLDRFLGAYLRQYEATRTKGYISLPFANHDLPRISIGRNASDVAVIYAFELTMPGVPFMYYGDEIGLRQLYGLPFTEGSYGTRAGARTPMQWSHGPNLGFSAAPPQALYRAVDPAADAPTVSEAQREPGSLLHTVETLVALRKTNPALAAAAEFTVLSSRASDSPFIFLRTSGRHHVLVALNPRNAERTATVKLDYAPARTTGLAGTGQATLTGEREVRLHLPPVSYAIVEADGPGGGGV